MVIYSAKSNEKIFHLPHCNIIRRIQKPYREQFDTQEEARLAGYRMCNCCSPIGGRLRKERQAINHFCQKSGASCRLEDNQLHIVTLRSEWKVVIGHAKKLLLYHKNTHENAEKTPSIISGYHLQAVRRQTISGYLDYIVQHDTFWEQQVKKARQKAESMNRLRKNTRSYQRGQDHRHFNANQLYSILDNVYL